MSTRQQIAQAIYEGQWSEETVEANPADWTDYAQSADRVLAIVEPELTNLRADLADALKALGPFARLASKRGCRPEIPDEQTVMGSAGYGGMDYCQLTAGDLRAAARILAKHHK